jgi:hypothetical protein
MLRRELLHMHRQLAEIDLVPQAEGRRHRPPAGHSRFSIDRDDRGTGQVQATREAAIGEGLEQAAVVPAALMVAGNG